ncbi:glutathione S-transferase family protein [Hyphococcus sp.]|uniref:glutathione S-transferase family protein n=1 Tax=Hyphococcus sp. TaxID=2038636 RepID=UPI0035C7582D
MLRVLGRTTSINVRKVLATLAEIGADYEHEPQWAGPDAPTSSPDFLRLNPNALIPVLIDDDFIMWESNAICRYLALKHERRDLYPENERERAVVDMWMDWQATELNNAWRDAFMGLVRKHPDYANPDRIAKSAERWNAMMGLLDARLSDTGGFIAGNVLTLADIVIGLSAHRWRSTPIDKAALPAVAVWLAKLDGRAAFARFATPDYP